MAIQNGSGEADPFSSAKIGVRMTEKRMGQVIEFPACRGRVDGRDGFDRRARVAGSVRRGEQAS